MQVFADTKLMNCWFTFAFTAYSLSFSTAVNESLAAIQASATQLQLESHSEVAKKNAVFYRQQHGVTRKDFKPREVCV